MSHVRRLVLSFFPVFSLAGQSAQAQAPVLIDCQETKLRASDPGTSDLYGHAVDIDGDVAVVGSVLDDNSHGGDAGAVYVYERTGGVWIQSAKLEAANGATSDLFGVSVAIDEDTIVVGASLDDTAGGGDAGSVYVFARCGGAWTQLSQLFHPTGAASDYFGAGVSIDGDTILVGCYADNTCAGDSGSAWVFVRNDSGTPNDLCDDTWALQSQLVPSVCQVGAQFGIRVDIQGDRAVVGANGEDSPEIDRGAAYVFERSGTAWSQTTQLLAGDGTGGDQFGVDVALDGNRILVGSYLDDAPEGDRGSTYYFERQAGFWLFQQKLVASNGTGGNAFGHALDLEGDIALVGAYGYGSSTGLAYLFRLGGSAWVEDQVVSACDQAVSDEYGFSLALDAGTALVGTRRDDDTAGDSGSVAVYSISFGRFERFGFGDGSGTPCPCSNGSAQHFEQGCANSRGWGGKLSVAGSDDAAADDVRLVACNMIAGNPALLFSGPTPINGGAGMVFGNGLRVVGGFLTRYNPPKAPDGNGRAVWGPGLSGGNGWPIGATVHFQVWYRDPFHSSCVDVFNLTNGVSVTFQ